MNCSRLIVRNVLFTALFLGLTLHAGAGDWPQWCGTNGKNMISTERGIPGSFDPGEKDSKGGFKPGTSKNVQWRAHVGAYTVSSPVVVGDRLYIGTVLNKKGAMKCFDVKTGSQVWQWISGRREVPQKIDERQFPYFQWQETLGVCSTAAAEDGRLYFVSQRCDVMCLDAVGDPEKIKALGGAQPDGDETDTSRVIWKYDMWENHEIRPSNVCNSSPLILGDYLYVCTSNGVDRQPNVNQHDEFRPVPSPDAPSVIVLNKKTGKLVAMDDLKIGASGRLLHGQYVSLSCGRVGGKNLVFFPSGTGILYAFEAVERASETPAKLKVAWSCDCVPQEFQHAHEKAGKSMILHYVQGDKRRADSTNKKNDGTFTGMIEFIATPVFYKGRVYIPLGRDPDHGRCRGGLFCIDPSKTGDITNTGKIWEYRDIDGSLSTVSISNGLLYVSDMAGRLHCVDPATGKGLWVYETKAQVWGSTLVADGKIFVPTHKGLYVFKESREPNEPVHIDLGSQMYNSPVVANGTLYVASKNYLWAIR